MTPFSLALRAWRPALVALALFQGAPAPSELATRLRAVLGELQAAQAPWYAELRAAHEEAARLRLLDAVPGRAFVPTLRAIEAAARGSDTGLEALVRLFGLGKELRDESLADSALAAIVDKHDGYLASPRLEGFCGFVSSWARPGRLAGSLSALRRILASSPHARVRAAALYALAGLRAQDDDDPDAHAEARTLYARLATEYADLRAWTAAAEAGLFELDHLGLGQRAPDFEAVDQDGVTFRLSDSLGSVVLIDFWGSW